MLSYKLNLAALVLLSTTWSLGCPILLPYNLDWKQSRSITIARLHGFGSCPLSDRNNRKNLLLQAGLPRRWCTYCPQQMKSGTEGKTSP